MTIQTKILKKYDFDTSEFELAVNSFYENCGITFYNKGDEIPKIDKKEAIAKSTKSFDNLIVKLVKIIKICGQESKIREFGDIYATENDAPFTIPRANLNTEKTDIDITIGVFRGFYIATDLKYVNNIKSMPDKFWQLITKLTELGNFEFIEQNKITPDLRKKYSSLFKTRGNIYKLTRNYFINQLEYGFCDSLGTLRVSWNYDIDKADLIGKFIETFKIMYSINHMLWTIENKITTANNV